VTGGRLRAQLGRWIPVDRRCRFHDVSSLLPEERSPRSPILQLYSGHPNIGNLTPVLGIQRLLGHETDTWCVHRRPIDFDFVHHHYRAVVIGGAGLLHRVFEPFWQQLREECRLPMAIWGVGGCFPDGRAEGGLPCPSAPAVADRCDLVNVRDDVTAEVFGFRGADVSACPTLAYLDGPVRRGRRGSGVLFSSHEELVGSHATRPITRLLARRFPAHRTTDNEQTRWRGVADIVRRDYLPSRLVVTTRLHGAIIAYGLGIPYLALARDEKLRAFARLYGNGVAVDELADLADALAGPLPAATRPIALAPVRAFGARARAWLAGLGCDLAPPRFSPLPLRTPVRSPAGRLPSTRKPARWSVGGRGRSAGQ
jgi:hypothetical protein